MPPAEQLHKYHDILEMTMERVYFTQYRGKKILIEDFTNLRPGEEFLNTIAAAQKTITSQPPKSVLALLDATGGTFNNEMLSAMKSFVSANTPYVKSVAVVGVKGFLDVALNILSKAAGRSFHTFSDRQSAMDFLITQ